MKSDSTLLYESGYSYQNRQMSQRTALVAQAVGCTHGLLEPMPTKPVMHTQHG